MTLPDGKLRKGIPSEETAQANAHVTIPDVFRERRTGGASVWGVGQWTPFPCQRWVQEWERGTFPATEMPGEVLGWGWRARGLEGVIWESLPCY